MAKEICKIFSGASGLSFHVVGYYTGAASKQLLAHDRTSGGWRQAFGKSDSFQSPSMNSFPEPSPKIGGMHSLIINGPDQGFLKKS
jgi:hypothetical protein